MFYDAAAFPFVPVLEAHWSEIWTEFQGIRDGLVDWFEKDLYGEGWKVFGLFNFPRGEPIPLNVQRCPLTARLIQEYVQPHGAAGFSLMRPGVRIRPHTGFQGEFLRCHLGLQVPAGDCALRVE